MYNELMSILIQLRKEAKDVKNLELADKIRDRLDKCNIQLKDLSDNTTSWNLK